MTKYGATRTRKHNTSKYGNRDLYRILHAYRNKGDLYKGRLRMRRGYSSRLYSPSRRQGYSSPTPSHKPKTAYLPRIHYRPEPPYRPQPKQSITRISSQPLYRPSRHTPLRIRTEPDVEEMLKQLEKRFDKKLQEQVLERLEAEMKELEEALKEKAESVEATDIQEQIESISPETARQELEPKEPNAKDTEATEINETSEETKPYDAQPEIEQTETQPSAEPRKNVESENELPTEDELYEIEDDFEWLREQIDETEIPDVSEEQEAIGSETEEPRLEHELDPLETSEQTNQELIEQQVIESVLNEIAPLEEHVEIEPEQLADLESILDQIEPIEPPLIEPIEENLLPEPLEEEVVEEEAAEGEAY